MSSYEQIKQLKIEPSEARDYFNVYNITGATTWDLWREQGVIGLDLIVHNRGAASLAISIDNSLPITINAGDSFSMSDIKFSLLYVNTAVATDIVVAGVKREPEQVIRELRGRH
jgi:hypothetical protein